MVSYTSIISVVMGFIVTFASGYFVIPYLRKLNFGQTILEDGPKWHRSKQGTPTMGGIMIIGGTVIALLVGVIFSLITKDHLSFEFTFSEKVVRWVAGFGLALGMGVIGFADDYIKVVKKRNLGLTARQKTFAQLILSTIYLVILLFFGGMKTTFLPFIGEVNVVSGFGVVFWPIALFFVYGFVNAVNLTDGVDGLASSVTLVVCCAFMVLGGVSFCLGANLVAASVSGALIGFVMWNAHPAKVFMGDTGSLFLGGLVVGLSFAVNSPILLIFSGIIYLIEAFSVMLQVAYYKRTKKRIFKMTPIHHHFEMCEWSEEKIVMVFSAVSLVGSVIAILLYIIRSI